MKSKLSTIYRKSDGIVAREISGELIIIPISSGVGDMGNELYALDETAKEIWARIDGKNTLGEIIDILEELYNAPAGVIREDVMGLVEEILKRGFVTEAGDL
jgi:hypothetical protein